MHMRAKTICGFYSISGIPRSGYQIESSLRPSYYLTRFPPPRLNDVSAPRARRRPEQDWRAPVPPPPVDVPPRREPHHVARPHVYFSQKIQRTKFDVSQKPLIQKMHTEPEILNWGLGGSIVCSDLHLCDSPARILISTSRILPDTTCTLYLCTKSVLFCYTIPS